MVVFHHSCAVKPSSSSLRSSPHAFLSVQCCAGVVTPPAAVASDVHQHHHNFLFFVGKKICLASTSDLSIMKQSKIGEEGDKENNGGVRLKLKLPRAEVEKLIQECKDEAEAAEKIMRLCMANGSRESESEIVEENGERVTLCWPNKCII